MFYLPSKKLGTARPQGVVILVVPDSLIDADSTKETAQKICDDLLMPVIVHEGERHGVEIVDLRSSILGQV